jgi:hypothetical protein
VSYKALKANRKSSSWPWKHDQLAAACVGKTKAIHSMRPASNAVLARLTSSSPYFAPPVPNPNASSPLSPRGQPPRPGPSHDRISHRTDTHTPSIDKLHKCQPLHQSWSRSRAQASPTRLFASDRLRGCEWSRSPGRADTGPRDRSGRWSRIEFARRRCISSSQCLARFCAATIN